MPVSMFGVEPELYLLKSINMDELKIHVFAGKYCFRH